MIVTAPFAAVAALAVFSPSDEGPTVCPFALCTGTACPGCGMTRAASYLFRGDVDRAMSYHPLIPVVTLLLTGGWAWYMLHRSGRVRAISGRTLNAILIAVTVALVAVWAVRLTSGTLPPV